MEAEQLNQIENQLKELGSRAEELKRYLDYPAKQDRLEEVVRLSEDPDIWNDQKKKPRKSAANAKPRRRGAGARPGNQRR